MKIAEMNNCIEKMREIYKFDDENTEIELDNECDMNAVTVKTESDDGVIVELRAYAERIKSIPRI